MLALFSVAEKWYALISYSRFVRMYCRTFGSTSRWQYLYPQYCFVHWEVIAVWSCPSGILFTAECNPSWNPWWSKVVHPKKWLSRNLSSNSVVLCLMQILSGVILEVLREAFTEIITAEVASAWTKLLANMCCGIAAVYEEVGWTGLSSSVEWRAPVYWIKRRFKKMNFLNWPFRRMQNIFWQWGVKQYTRGSFWVYATKFTENERG